MMSNPIAVEQQAVPCSGLKAARALHPAEYMLTGIVLLLAFASLALTLGCNVRSPGRLCTGYSGRLRDGRIGRLCPPENAGRAFGIGRHWHRLFMGFTAFASICTFALFPLQRPLVDLPLIAADAAFGYDWPGL